MIFSSQLPDGMGSELLLPGFVAGFAVLSHLVL